MFGEGRGFDHGGSCSHEAGGEMPAGPQESPSFLADSEVTMMIFFKVFTTQLMIGVWGHSLPPSCHSFSPSRMAASASVSLPEWVMNS